MVNEAQNFYIPALEIQSTADTLLLHGGDTTSSFFADGSCEIKVPQSWAMNTFQFLTDAQDVTNANSDDIKFRMVSYTQETGGITGTELKFHNPKNIVVGHASMTGGEVEFYNKSNTIANNKTLAADYVRHCALLRFGTSEAVDIFNNEVEVRNELINDSSNAFTNKITELSGNGSKIHYSDMLDYVRMETTLANINNTEYTTESAQNAAVDKGMKFPSRVIFAQLLDGQLNRFDDLNTFESKELRYLFLNDGTAATGADTAAKVANIIASGEQVWRKIPFMVDDNIYFKLIVNGGSNVDANSNPIAPYSYRVKLNVVEDDDPKLAESDTPNISYNWPWSAAGYPANDYISYLNNTDQAPVTIINPDGMGQ